MKRNILWTIAAAILFSCTDSMQEYAAMDDLNNNVQTESDRSHFVSKSDIAALLRAQSNSTRSVSECEDDITCFIDEKHDTLVYQLLSLRALPVPLPRLKIHDTWF